MISIHGPRVGADEAAMFLPKLSVLFQSTAPVWGPTKIIVLRDYIVLFQSTAPVWGPTAYGRQKVYIRAISIHGPRVGADSKC